MTLLNRLLTSADGHQIWHYPGNATHEQYLLRCVSCHHEGSGRTSKYASLQDAFQARRQHVRTTPGLVTRELVVPHMVVQEHADEIYERLQQTRVTVTRDGEISRIDPEALVVDVTAILDDPASAEYSLELTSVGGLETTVNLEAQRTEEIRLGGRCYQIWYIS